MALGTPPEIVRWCTDWVLGLGPQAYLGMNQVEKKIEILYASMDFTEEERNHYLQGKPFYGLPYDLGGHLKRGWEVCC